MYLSERQQRFITWLDGKRTLIPPTVANIFSPAFDFIAEFICARDDNGPEFQAAIEVADCACKNLLEIAGGFAAAMGPAEPGIQTSAAFRHQIRLLSGIFVNSAAELSEAKRAAWVQEHAAGVQIRHEAVEREKAARERREREEEERAFLAYASSLTPTAVMDMVQVHGIQLQLDAEGHLIVTPPGSLPWKHRRLLTLVREPIIEAIKSRTTDRI